MRRLLLCALPALALTCVLALPDVSFAQRRGGVGVGIGRGGVSIGSGNFGYGSGYGNPGFGGYGSGYGLGGYGYPGYGGYGSGITIGSGGIRYGSGYGGYGYGSGYGYPGYGGGWSSPGYYGSGWSSPGYYGGSNVYQSGYWSQEPSVAGGANASYQSFYPSGGANQFNDGTRAMIRVHVPPDAEVMFEGSATQQRGPERVFVTPPLEGTGNYTYKVSARWRDQNGQEVTRDQTVRFSAGRTVDVNFTSAQGSPQDPAQPKNLRPNPAGSEEQSEPALPDQTTPSRRPQQDVNPSSTVPQNPGNATPPPETRPERRPQPDK